jgi:cephalosporin-C deacetylase-like acetyl esterase
MRSIVIAAFIATMAYAQDAAWQRMQESKRQVTDYLQRLARAQTDRAAQEMRTVGSWEAARAKRLEEMRDMLGLLPWPARTPLNVRVTGTLEKGSYIVEKIAFESIPKIYVSANLYIPKERPSPAPAIIYVCGHSYSPHGDKAQYQRHGISFAKNGYIAFILDSIQIAETYALHHGVSSQEMYDWYARGYSPAGVEVWNAMRAIDYLETRPEVDKTRIGMTGRSGGAAMSWFTAAVDPRIKAAIPVMGISTYAANLRENTQKLHCDCMFPVNSLLHDMLHQGALIAPRPLLMAHGRQDRLFPVEGFTEFERVIGALYKDYGKSEEFRNIVVETGHQDSDYLREQAIRWFDQHLRKIPARKLAMEYTNAPEPELAVFPDAAPADALNYRVHELFLRTPPFRKFASLAQWEKRRTQILSRLRERVFRAFPAQPAPVRVISRTRAQGAQFEEIEFAPDEGVTVRGLLNAPSKVESKVPALLYVASDGEDARAIQDVFSPVTRRTPSVRMAVYPRGVGEVSWDKTFWKDTLRNSMHVGHTVDSMRLWDVLRAIEVLRREPHVDPDRITVMGRGVAAGLALYAAILDPKVHQVLLLYPPSSHVDGPWFLNVLRYTDLPEVAALMAPRRLNFYGRIPPAYEATRQVYALYQKPGHVFLTMSIPGILEGRYDHGYSSGF